ncbi:MAG: PQQ-dependent sugar dehydrogenase [Planctomycetes bacterium]|nr:PQQ-dependent sugar dehydrogenase [Planctomycetota bacterium]
MPRSVALLSSLFLFAAGSAALAQTVPGGFAVGAYGGGISNGTAMAWAPDGRLFVCQQTGTLRVIKNGALLGTPFHAATVDSGGERGLLGVAFDPDFLSNGYVYIYYTTTTPATHNCIRRLSASAPGSDVSSGTETVITDLDNLSVATNHNGGAIHFGPDGKLYVAVGENANGANAQSLANRLGKVLRYNPDGTIPADNPASFPGIAGTTAGANQAIWAVGFRNPFTFAFQPGTGRLFVNDVGEVTWEEINDGLAGLNYGWAGGSTDGVRSMANFTDPIHTYNHGGLARAIAGGAFYNPTVVQFPASYVGKYFFAEYVGGWISYIDPASPAASTSFATSVSSPVDLQVGPDGALYFLARGGAAGVYRIAYTGVVTQNLIVSTNQLSVTEGSTAVFNVQLALDPVTPLSVTVANVLGSGTVSATATVNFTSGNWSVNQPVTVSAAGDADAFDTSATLQLTAPSVPSQSVVVTVVDTGGVANHPTARIALPLNGASVSGATAEFFGNGTPVSPATMTKADFYIDGNLLSTDTNASGHYHYGGAGHNGWDTTGLSNGTHLLRMTVTDNGGKTGSHEVAVIVQNGVPGGGGGGGSCGSTGLEPCLLLGLAALLRRTRRR